MGGGCCRRGRPDIGLRSSFQENHPGLCHAGCQGMQGEGLLPIVACRGKRNRRCIKTRTWLLSLREAMCALATHTHPFKVTSCVSQYTTHLQSCIM